VEYEGWSFNKINSYVASTTTSSLDYRNSLRHGRTDGRGQQQKKKQISWRTQYSNTSSRIHDPEGTHKPAKVKKPRQQQRRRTHTFLTAATTTTTAAAAAADTADLRSS